MYPALKNYLHSFKLDRNFLQTFLADLISFSLIFGLFFLITSKAQTKMMTLTGGKSLEELQQMTAAFNPEQLSAFNQEIFSAAILTVAVMILWFVVSWMVYSLSNAYVWNVLTEKKLARKNYWRWNLLNLAIIIPLIPYFIAYLFLRLIFNQISGLFSSPNVSYILTAFLNQFFIVFFLTILFLVYYSFVRDYRAWNSIGESFHLLKIHWKQLWKFYGFTFLTLLVINIPLALSNQYFISHSIFMTLISSIILLLFISWMRIYLVRSLHSEHSFVSESQKTL